MKVFESFIKEMSENELKYLLTVLAEEFKRRDNPAACIFLIILAAWESGNLEALHQAAHEHDGKTGDLAKLIRNVIGQKADPHARANAKSPNLN